MSSWTEFWNRPNRIYVNARHLDVHYRRVADDIRALVPHSSATVLDFGCGDALAAERVASGVGRLLLYDRAPATRDRLTARFAGHAAIAVLDEAGLAALPPHSIDLIVVNSVIQYLSAAELTELLVRCQGWLRPGGRVLIADVIPPDSSALSDAACLLRTAWANGFLGAAVVGLGATFFSDYRRIRSALGLSTYTPATLAEAAREAGFHAARQPRNLGFNQNRMAFSLTVAPS